MSLKFCLIELRGETVSKARNICSYQIYQTPPKSLVFGLDAARVPISWHCHQFRLNFKRLFFVVKTIENQLSPCVTPHLLYNKGTVLRNKTIASFELGSISEMIFYFRCYPIGKKRDEDLNVGLCAKSFLHLVT